MHSSSSFWAKSLIHNETNFREHRQKSSWNWLTTLIQLTFFHVQKSSFFTIDPAAAGTPGIAAGRPYETAGTAPAGLSMDSWHSQG